MTGTFKDRDITGRLGEIEAPTLVLGGEHDEARPAHMADIAARIPDADLQIFDDASHLCFWEKREEFMGTVNGFLDLVEAA